MREEQDLGVNVVHGWFTEGDLLGALLGEPSRTKLQGD